MGCDQSVCAWHATGDVRKLNPGIPRSWLHKFFFPKLYEFKMIISFLEELHKEPDK